MTFSRFAKICVIGAAVIFAAAQARAAQQKEEIVITTAVSNLAFSALWVAEQLKYFDEEGLRVKVAVAGGGSPCQNAVVGRSAQFCASSSEGLVLAYVEGAPLIAVQAHNSNLTLTVGVRKAIAAGNRPPKRCAWTSRSDAPSCPTLTQATTKLPTSSVATSGRYWLFVV